MEKVHKHTPSGTRPANCLIRSQAPYQLLYQMINNTTKLIADSDQARPYAGNRSMIYGPGLSGSIL